MTLNLDIPDVPDHNGPAPPPYTPYATETESTVLDVDHHHANGHSAPNGSGSASASSSSIPQTQLSPQTRRPTPPDNAEAGPSRPAARHSSISKSRPSHPPDPEPEVSSATSPTPHTPPRPEDLRDRGRSNSAWRQYLRGLSVSENATADLGRLSLEDKTNKPLPPTPPSLPPRSSRPPPPVPPPPSRLDPRSRQPPPPPRLSPPLPARPNDRQGSTPITWHAQQSHARPQVEFPGGRQPQSEAVHHTWHYHPQHQQSQPPPQQPQPQLQHAQQPLHPQHPQPQHAQHIRQHQPQQPLPHHSQRFPHPQPQPPQPQQQEQPRRQHRHSVQVVQSTPVQYVHEVPPTVQRVYEVPQTVRQVHEVREAPAQQAQPVRQVQHVHSVPQFAHPDSRHLVRPLDPRHSYPGTQRGRQNGHAVAGFAGPSAAGPSFQQLGLPEPSIPDRRSSLPRDLADGSGPQTSPKQNSLPSSPAAQFPPPILRTAPKPAQPVSFPPPPRHIVARGGRMQRSQSTPRTPRKKPSIIDLTQDTSPSSAGSPPKQRAQSDVGRPSGSGGRADGSAVGSVGRPNGSAVGSAVNESVASAPPSAAVSRSVVSAPSAVSTPRRRRPSDNTASSPASPSKARCSGFTRAGERCKRLVRGGAPGAPLLDDPDSGRYCKDHAGLLLRPAGFYWRAAVGGAGTWVEFKTYIPRALGAQTQALLRTTMESALSGSEAPGFLYVYELRGMGGASTAFFKVGRSDNVPRRIGQWASQCASHAPVLRDVFPLSAANGSTLPGARARDAARMAAAAKRWERLVHLELADRAAAERPLAYKTLEAPCPDCGAVHREIFPLPSSEGYDAVVEVISRWEKFVRAISST